VSRRLKIAAVPKPSVQRAVSALPQQRAAIRGVWNPNRGVSRQEQFHHLSVSVERRPPDWFPVIHAPSERVETQVEHQRDGWQIVRMRPVGDHAHLLRMSHDQFWKELRVACPRSATAAPLDLRADITQIGVVALSLVLGRALRDVRPRDLMQFPARQESA